MGKYDSLSKVETLQQLQRLHEMERDCLEELARIDKARAELKRHLQRLEKK